MSYVVDRANHGSLVASGVKTPTCEYIHSTHHSDSRGRAALRVRSGVKISGITPKLKARTAEAGTRIIFRAHRLMLTQTVRSTDTY